jgi:IS5 family transposase
LTQLRVIDSFPLSVCHLRRLSGSSTPFEYFATVGYCAAKKEYFYGFRIHVVTDARGVVLHYLLTSGHVHDTKGLVFLLQDAATLPRLLERLIALIGDKGYTGAELKRRLKQEFGIDLLARAQRG